MSQQMIHSHRYVAIEWVGMPTAESSASLELPCKKLIVIPLLLLSFEDVIIAYLSISQILLMWRCGAPQQEAAGRVV